MRPMKSVGLRIARPRGETTTKKGIKAEQNIYERKGFFLLTVSLSLSLSLSRNRNSNVIKRTKIQEERESLSY